MTKYRWLAAAVVAGVLALAIAPVSAGEDETEDMAPPSEKQVLVEKVFKRLALAGELAEYGRQNKAAEALVAAGGIYMELSKGVGDFGKMKEPALEKDGTPTKDASEPTKSFASLADEAFEAARLYPIKGVNVEALIKAAKDREPSDGLRGLVGGPKTITRKVQAGGHTQFVLNFKENEPAGIAMQSNHPVRFIIKSEGKGTLANAIVTHGNYTWVPKPGTKKITIHVHGMGRSAEYRVYAN